MEGPLWVLAESRVWPQASLLTAVQEKVSRHERFREWPGPSLWAAVT